MKGQIIIIFLILIARPTFAQIACDLAKMEAHKDFKKGNYFLHSLSFQPVENTYLFVLRKDYNIQWRFIDQDSLDYYRCYDSSLIIYLKKKYGNDFLNKATLKADSLENTENWKRQAQFPGGDAVMLQFIMERLKVGKEDLDERLLSKVLIQFTVTETGKLKDIKIIRGISQKIDDKMIAIFKQMPNWTPAHLYGKPIIQKYTRLIRLCFKL